jgi:hypothetical protein
MKLLSLIIIIALSTGCMRYTQVMPMSGITYSSTDPSPTAYSPKIEDPNLSTGGAILILLGVAGTLGLGWCFLNYMGSGLAASAGHRSSGICAI